MARIDTIQTSFTGGELGPSLKGRTDIQQYANACAIVQNWIPRPFGSILSTPGTEYINACKTGGSTTLAGVRLIPFQFSVTDSYIIEMGVGYFRFYTNGAIVVTGSTIYEVAHTYAAADIPSIQFCQNHDVIYLAHANYAPATLIRSGSATNWVLSNFAFTGGPFQPVNLTTTQISISNSASGSTMTVTASTGIFSAGDVGTYWSLGSTFTSATTGLDVQGYFQIIGYTSSTIVAATVQAAITEGSGSDWAKASWSSNAGWPARCTFYQSRLFFARTNTEPQTVWGSGTFNFTDFAVNGGADDDALDLQVSATQGNDIKWMTPMNDLIVGTYGGEFCISAGIGTGNPLTPSTTGVINQTSWGSEAIVPKKIGNFAYYVQRGFQKLREISFQFLSSNYKSTDKTILSPQINSGAFIDIAYQQNPDTVLWCLCTNGSIATLTREVDQDVQAWARQVTLGTYSSIAIIPSQQGPYDEVWTITQRTIKGAQVNYVERFVSQIVPVQGTGSLIPQQDQCWYIHCGLQYDAFSATTTPTATSISLSSSYATNGTTVVVTSSAVYFVAGDVGDRLRAVDAYDNILGEITITGYTSSTIIVGTVTLPFSAPSYSAGFWGVSVTTLTGLQQLAGATVTVLADGGLDLPSKVVTTDGTGTITLAYNYFVVNVGLPAPQILSTLPQEPPDKEGTSQGKVQRINNCGFKLNNSYTGFQYGGTTSSTTSLFPLRFRNPLTSMGTAPLLYTGEVPNNTVQDDYHYGSQLNIVNSDPLPIEILAITTAIETFDK